MPNAGEAMVQGENYVLFTRYDINIAKGAEMTLCMCVHGLNTKNILQYERVCRTSLLFHNFKKNFTDHLFVLK